MQELAVYYQKRDYAHHGLREFEVEADRVGQLMISDIPDTHTLLRTVEVEERSDVYMRMQFVNWTRSEKEEIHPADVEHKDFEAGDVYQTIDGRFYECLFLGWRLMS